MWDEETDFYTLKQILAKHSVELRVQASTITFAAGEKQIDYLILPSAPAKQELLPWFTMDAIINTPEIISGMVLSKLKLNTTIYARKCTVKKVDSEQKDVFLSQYHLMGTTSSAYNLGLFVNDHLVALATFSKGRKMNRLPEQQRSFELIRFCSKHGTTISGGLSKLVKYFCKLKNAGDIMTYVNTQYGDERAFIAAGFKRADEYDSSNVQKLDLENHPLKTANRNIKVIFNPGKI